MIETLLLDPLAGVRDAHMGSKKAKSCADSVPESTRTEKDPNAVKRGKIGGLIGGKARAKSLSSNERKTIASLGAKTRWSNYHAAKRVLEKQITVQQALSFAQLTLEGMSASDAMKAIGLPESMLLAINERVRDLGKLLRQ